VEDGVLFARMHAGLHAFYRLVATGARGSRLFERDGVTAAVVPAAANRSVANGVAYDSAPGLAGLLDELAQLYDEAGVSAWTVWVPHDDREAAELLARNGHVLDADPAAMVMELDRFERSTSTAVEIDDDADPADVARINDAAYGYDGDFARAFSEFRMPGLHSYAAIVGGEPQACLTTLEQDGDCLVTFVATLPAARGRGLATELMTRALADARERGCTSTSLQATKAGEPIYARLGYRSLGPLQMWERRKPA
jgi:GNAT superfamily N-acetyltransferase